jgi:hypothetical protein
VAVLRKRRRRQILEVRAVELGQQLLPIQRLHLGAVGLEHVAQEPPRASFGHGPLQHLSELARQSCVLTPYRFSKASVIGPESRVFSEV